MTLSTGYTGEGEEFGWIIPVPTPPAVYDVFESGEAGEEAFETLDWETSPVVSSGHSGGCFPAGTEVLTADGPQAIESIGPGTAVYSFNITAGVWGLSTVMVRQTIDYSGDVIDLRLNGDSIRVTGNHPFFVVQGDGLPLRPLPEDISKEEQIIYREGRWVEARDLKPGDVLKAKGGEPAVITGISKDHQNLRVFNLSMDGNHTYAVHERGILVHNKAATEGSDTEAQPVEVYGTLVLDHYEVSILGAAAAAPLLGWLTDNGYSIAPESLDVLDTYIDRNWAFVAVKLTPGEKRRYDNEFLPPLTIQYRYDELIFPLRISSVSTEQEGQNNPLRHRRRYGPFLELPDGKAAIQPKTTLRKLFTSSIH